MNRLLDFVVGVPAVLLLSPFAGRKGQGIPTPRKILLVKLAAAGDTIILLPVVAALRERFPEAEIHWVVSPINADLARRSPAVDRFWLLEDFSPTSLLRLVRQLKEEAFDVVVDLEQWARGTALLSSLTGAPVRLGFETPGQWRHGVYTHVLPKRFVHHEQEDFYALLEALSPLERRSHFDFRATDRGREEFQGFLTATERASGGERRVLIHPGCGTDGLPREWPLERYGELGRWLLQEMRAEVLLTGGPEEREKTARLNGLLEGGAVDAGGRLSWEGMMALIQEVDLVISGNTGVMHLAAALKKNQIALHGPTDPALWGPLNPRAVVLQSPCPQCPSLRLGFEYHAKDQSCMARIPLEAVKEAVRSVWRA